ncbi:MAG: AAA family ATPase [Oscillospiraceae bacterium]|jgi:hypothetical protein|nr:AAA family ATPase [Oscillospiraceae bacterium]
MSKPLIILADTDDRYLAPMELKFLEELYDKIELEVITDAAYFKAYFATPRRSEIIVVSRELYSSELQKHNIAHIFVLSEQNDNQTEELDINSIFKYRSVKEIYNEIMFNVSESLFVEKQALNETTVAAVYSPCGGTGKTTLAMGVAASLAQSFKRVLYLNAEHMHSFHYYLNNKECLRNEAYPALQQRNEDLYRDLKPYFRKELFDYLPPFCASLSALNIDFKAYAQLIRLIKGTRDYDYIIVDTDFVFDEAKAELLSMANRVLLTFNQDSFSVFKTQVLLNNIDFADNEKYLFICNAYKADEESFAASGSNTGFVTNEYVDYIEGLNSANLETLLSFKGFQKLAYSLL